MALIPLGAIPAVTSKAVPLVPKLFSGQAGARGQRFQLGPHHTGMNSLDDFRLGKAAIGSGDHIFASDEICKADDAVGDETRMLDYDRVVGNDAGDKNFSAGQPSVAPDAPLVLVARICCFDGIRSRSYAENQISEFFERSIRKVGHMPTAEAYVVTDTIFRDSSERMVEGIDTQLSPLPVAMRAGLDEFVVHVG